MKKLRCYLLNDTENRYKDSSLPQFHFHTVKKELSKLPQNKVNFEMTIQLIMLFKLSRLVNQP